MSKGPLLDTKLRLSKIRKGICQKISTRGELPAPRLRTRKVLTHGESHCETCNSTNLVKEEDLKWHDLINDGRYEESSPIPNRSLHLP